MAAGSGWKNTGARVADRRLPALGGCTPITGGSKSNAKVGAIGDAPIARVDLSVSDAMQTHSIELSPRRADETLAADTYIGRLEIPKVAFVVASHAWRTGNCTPARLQVRFARLERGQ